MDPSARPILRRKPKRARSGHLHFRAGERALLFPIATAVRAQHLLVRVVDYCRCHALAVTLLAAVLAVFSGFWAATHLGLSSETDRLFSPDLAWRQRAAAIKAEFPQLQNLLVAVVDARETEQAEITAADLSRSPFRCRGMLAIGRAR